MPLDHPGGGPSLIGMASPTSTLVPRTDLEAFLGDTDLDDGRADQCLEAARQSVERMITRTLTAEGDPFTEAQTFEVAYSGGTTYDLGQDLQSATRVETRREGATEWTVVTDYELVRYQHQRPYRAVYRESGWPRGRLRVTGTWGLALTPDLTQAILQEAAYLYQSAKYIGGDLVSADGQTEDEMLARNPAFYTLIDAYKVGMVR